MSRFRLAIVAGVLAIFIAVGAYLIFGNKNDAPKNITFNVTVTGAKTMHPSELSVHQNDTVTINMTSDTTGEVHLHGYDIAFDCVAGQVVSHTFKAVNTGDFPIEWESTSTPLGDLKVNP
jgi:heme/copper-type cytochrome/quinol oxidase subunit 2